MQTKVNNIENLSNKIKISICMTTHNRSRFIGETLENLISQTNDQVEIVIVDGASTDDTAEVVQSFQQRFGNLIYHRGERNYGVDSDMATCVELARGEYCWLFSDDDWLKPGAIDRILKELESKYEIYLCNATRCSLSMEPVRENFWLSRGIKDKVFSLHDKSEFIEYCNSRPTFPGL